jgi:hypothetical protein
MLARVVTSHARASDLPPADLISAAADCASSARRPVGTTLAPALARPLAMARPMPEVPPMTTAVGEIERGVGHFRLASDEV